MFGRDRRRWGKWPNPVPVECTKEQETEPGSTLLGRLRRRQLDQNPEDRAEQVMENGPSIHRPDVTAKELLERMKSRGFESAFVTDPDGRLWGIVSRADLEGALGEARP